MTQRPVKRSRLSRAPSFSRALLSSHTIKPDFDDIDVWLDRLFGAVQSLKLPNWGAFIASLVPIFNISALTLLKTYS